MRRALAVLVALAVAGCDQAPKDPPPNVNQKPIDPAYVRKAGPAPILITYRPSGLGGPEVFRAAIVGGVLDFTGPCIRLADSGGSLRTVVASSGTALKRDSMGWFLPSGTDRLRHGATVEGGGGEMPALPPADTLSAKVPGDCLTGPAVEMVAIHRSAPAPQGRPPEPSPPPPPGR